MNLQDIHIERFHLPFKNHFMNGGISITGKDVAILRVTCDGVLHEGEIGPFPGVHDKDLSDTLKNLALPRSLNIPAIDQWRLSENKFGLELPGEGEAISSAWEQVLFSIYWALQKYSLNGQLLQAGLLTLGEGAESQAQTLVSNGFKTIKIKVGRSLKEDEAFYLKHVKDVCGNKVKFRLDGNQNLQYSQIEEFASILGEQLEYVEEPFESIHQNLDLDFPVALDECLWGLKKMFDFEEAPFLVLKPMKVGLSQVFYWVKEQRWPKNKIVLSSCFDTGIALRHYIKLACLLELSSAHGFGTYRFFEKDVLPEPLPLHKGAFMVGGENWN